MEANLDIINTFATRVRQLILQNRDLRKENAGLYAMVDDRDKEISRYKELTERLQHEYDSLKIAKMMEITDGDVDAARKRINKLIGEVNKCITMLSSEK